MAQLNERKKSLKVTDLEICRETTIDIKELNHEGIKNQNRPITNEEIEVLIKSPTEKYIQSRRTHNRILPDFERSLALGEKLKKKQNEKNVYHP